MQIQHFEIAKDTKFLNSDEGSENDHERRLFRVCKLC